MAGNPPCASCKLLRRRCSKDCIFAPFFPPDQPHKFAIVHKVFGASNVAKMLQELPLQKRADAVSSLAYEANARIKDPVYGCVGAISYLQNQVQQLQMQLAMARAEILCFHEMLQDSSSNSSSSSSSMALLNQQLLHNQIEEDDKSLLLHTAFSSFSDQSLDHYSSASCIVFQEPIKRESLWT